MTSGTSTPILSCQTPGTLSFGYVGGIQSALWTLDSDGWVNFHFTLFPKSFLLGTASGYLQISGLPYTIDQPINTIGTLNWRGINKPGFTQINVSTRVGVHNDRLVLRCNGMCSNDGLVNITDLMTGTDDIDFCGWIRYRAGTAL